MDFNLSEDDQDLLDIEVAGSAYSTSRVADLHDSEPTLQPTSIEGHDSSSTKFSWLQVHGNTDVIIENACESILEPANLEWHAPSESMTSTLHVEGITELSTKDACNPVMHQPKVKVHESAHNLVTMSPYFLLGLENKMPTTNFRRPSQVRSVPTELSLNLFDEDVFLLHLISCILCPARNGEDLCSNQVY